MSRSRWSTSSLVLCNASTESTLRCWLHECQLLMEHLKPLLDAFVIDFYVDDHLKNIHVVPQGVKAHLLHLQPEEMADLLEMKHNKLTTIRPLWLLCLQSLISRLSLNRRPVKGPGSVINALLDTNATTTNDVWMSLEKELERVGSGSSVFHLFRKNVKTKKQHEVVRMAALASALQQARSLNLSDADNSKEKRRLVDVGGGRGHLARLLAFQHNFEVLCVDTDEKHVAKAPQLDQGLWKGLKRKGVKEKEKAEEMMERGRDCGHVHHVNLDLNPHKVDIVESCLEKHLSSSSSYGLIGLHACGDLGSTCLHFFCSSDRVHSVQLASCCYMKNLSLFPMSSFLQSQMRQSVSHEAMELACHAMENYVQRLRCPMQLQTLKSHCYRALLELVLREKNEKLIHCKLAKVQVARTKDFADYALKATRNLENNEEMWTNCQLLQCERISSKQENWWHVVAFYSLRLMLAPIIETVVLLDRVLYLREQLNINVALVPIFEPEQSPRCFVITAMKNK